MNQVKRLIKKLFCDSCFAVRDKGFTLIELIAVIGIIGILSGIVLAVLQEPRAKARDARRLSDMTQIQKALELYELDNGNFPVQTTQGAIPDLVTGGYLGQVIVDPLVGYTQYAYISNVSGNTYCIGADLELETFERDTCSAVDLSGVEFTYKVSP